MMATPEALPEYMNALFIGPFDYAVLALLVGANGWLYWHGAARPLGCGVRLASALFFCLILPVLSMKAELVRAQRPPGIPVDGYELLYCWFRFPMYWAVFVGQCASFWLYRWRNQPHVQPQTGAVIE
ncbi:hypothetical protein KB206_00350 [Microvirga sp. STS02]|uniref:hypothetical protein n=1 Tax=Hymenobacter negativus TaxID=2795026 RepID=UPI0018DD416B|nr:MULTISPECIES: hypothetical protein [Bacteria]MBH8567315.1 hypothetical protein [Hymenobacter negativus]MBR7207047.1 hypothetical protein [Microvirga sp. STS02]